jgi:NTP pyrophosphatase (non-canonical NTP hydrolase)
MESAEEEMDQRMPEITITELVKQSHETAVEKGWWDDDPELDKSFGTAIALIHSEASEALEEYRDGRKYDEIYYREDGKPEGIPVEFADVVIRIADQAGERGIPLLRAIEEKLAFNKTREHRHGNKKC